MGGSHGGAAHHANNPANLLALCRPCHDFTEDQPRAARAIGWLVQHAYDSWSTPALIVPIYGKGWYFLLPDATYGSASAEDTEAFLRRVDTESV